jgi:topoisomerase-4 subunit A
VETSTVGQRFRFVTDHKDSRVYGVSLVEDPVFEIGYMSQRQKMTEELRPAEVIDVKGWKALGNKVVDKKLISIRANEVAEEPEDDGAPAGEGGGTGRQGDLFGGSGDAPQKQGGKGAKKGRDGFLNTGDTVEFDV